MHKISVSHEVPLNMLDTQMEFNDYDFILPFFYERYEKYREYVSKAKSLGRWSILDCGLFEGEVSSDEKLLELIDEIKPSLFIIPDVWNNSEETLGNAIKWQKYKVPHDTKLMPVIQANKFNEALNLYKLFKLMGFNHIAVNHSGNYFIEVYDVYNDKKDELVSDEIKKMKGRILFLNLLNSIDNDGTYIHLLGITHHSELSLLKSLKLTNFISSIDTSNPIIYGLTKGDYKNDEVPAKINQKMEEFFEKDISPLCLESINNNILKFKNLLK